jgi:quinol-cytochrome oxidoreductase complex cytochrome b subunit
MHGHNTAEFLRDVAGFLGGYYLFLAAMNATAALYLWRSGRARPIYGPLTTASVWLGLALFFTIVSPLAFSGDPDVMRVISVPPGLRTAINRFMDPVVYSVGSLVLLGVFFVFRRFLVQPTVAWISLNAALLLMGMSMTDPNFAEIVRKPDNVPIVGMIFLLGFFTWLAAYKAVNNDERIKRGLPPEEMEDNEKVLVWPDLVYTELICMVALTAFLFVWAICLQAPLEEPASAVKTPNPSKAPWYFLGLQEMLVYYDPWMAGVVAPSLIIFGLMAIPYLDFNKKGNGYYTIAESKFS